MKVEEFINLKKGIYMSVDEYSFKFSMFCIYAPSIVLTPRDEMSHFVFEVADLVREVSRTSMLHHDMTLARLMVYAKSIEEYKHGRISRNMKRSASSDQGKYRFKKRIQTQGGTSPPKVKFEKGGGS